MGKASVNFQHEWVGRLLAVHYGCRISILIILKQTSSKGSSGTNGSSFYYSSFAGIEDVIRRAARHAGREGIAVWGGIAYPSQGRSSNGAEVTVGHGCKIREGQGGKSRTADKDRCNAPTTEASADQVLIKIFMHQHCCLNLPLPAPNPLSSPMMDITSLEHFWKKMPFFCFIFSLTFAFGSLDEMWIWSYLNWLPTWRKQR